MKRYLKPEIQIVDVENEVLMAASGPDRVGASISDSDTDVIGAGSSVDAKNHGFSVWGDDEDDD